MKNLLNFRVIAVILLILGFSYQPPIEVVAQETVISKIDTFKIDTVSMKMDTTLIDTLVSLRLQFEVSKTEAQLNLIEVQNQQAALKQLSLKD